MKPPKVGIVILTYNSQSYIRNCLESIVKSSYSNFLCVIIDNNSSDQTIHIVKKKFPKIHMIKNEKNEGYAAGNNIGVRYLLDQKCDYILLLNPDTIISSSLLRECVDVFTKKKSIGIVGPIITYAHEPDRIWFSGGYFNRLFCYTKHSRMNKKILYPILNSQFSTLNFFSTDFITGACMMIRKEVFKKVGLLPEEYFMYWEDVDFCERVKKAGYKIMLLKKPLVRHAISAASGYIGSNVLSPFQAYYYGRNPIIYIKNQVHGWQKIPNYLGQFLIRFPFYSLLLIKSGKPKNILSYIHGMYDGVLY